MIDLLEGCDGLPPRMAGKGHLNGAQLAGPVEEGNELCGEPLLMAGGTSGESRGTHGETFGILGDSKMSRQQHTQF